MQAAFLKDIYKFTLNLFNQRLIMSTLIIRDFKSRYFTSYLGLPWAFIQPASYILVIWFAFTYGLRGGGTGQSNNHFTAWLIVAMIPWMFISQTMIVACSSLQDYSYVIKKTPFNVALIPMVKIFSGLLVHFILIACIIFLLIFFFGIQPTIYWIQIIYYIFATVVLLTGISWIVSSVNVFVRDMAHIVNIMVSMLFWATPIIWPYSMLTGNFKYIALLNPFFYITEGYRYAFLEKIWFFEYLEMNIYFWAITLFLFISGALIFNKLRVDFGDVLR